MSNVKNSCLTCLYGGTASNKSPCNTCGDYRDNWEPDKVLKEQKDNPLSPSHYSRYKIQPLTFITENGLDFLTGNIIKYIMRHDAKNGLEDLKKARVYLDKLVEKVEKQNG